MNNSNGGGEVDVAGTIEHTVNDDGTCNQSGCTVHGHR